jgi:GrpB-like predicted nucleotidyltransferase (UPF0157 family)
MSIGLKRGTVQLRPYDPHWVVEFEKEKQKLLDVFGDKIIGIEHVGSTAVPGLPAKPLIDMIAAIHSFVELEDFIEPLEKLGYEYMPERMFKDRKFFPKGPRSNRKYHLNLVLENSPEQWLQPLLFRDYLRNHEDARNEYAQLKTSLAAKHSDNREAYTKSKSDFIQRIIFL